MHCPNCNIHYNDPNMRFCVSCGEPLVGDTTPRNRQRTTTPRQQPPPPVVVEMGRQRRQVRRSYLLILLVMLLLLLLCGCLLFTDVVAAPIFLTDIFREYTRLGFGCLNGILLLFIFYLIIIILKLDFNCIYVPIGLLIIMVLCVILNIIGAIELPDLVDRIVDRVTDPIRTLPLPWNPNESSPRDNNGSDTSSGCCPDYNFNNIYYDNGALFFDVSCRTQDFRSQCADGKVYDGAGNFWTNVSCCVDPNYNTGVLRCEGLDYVTAKVGNVRLELEYEGKYGKTCQIYSTFPPPAFSVPEESEREYSGADCPSGQSKCDGTCCSIGHCCDCGYGLSCYSDCSGCSY